MRSKWLLLVLGWILVLVGGGLAHRIQTADGVSIEDVRFEFEPGKELSALIYKPPGVSAESPAPGILAVHGYINSRETQSGFAIEFARRGYVVLAIDQTGHGFSDGAAFSAGFGGPAALRYLRSLPYVDADSVGLEGHSMGGWTSLAAAEDQPDGYRSIALVGSSTGAPFAAEGSPDFPRNLAVIFSRYDEFSELMWGVAKAQQISQSSKLQKVFGTDQEIEVGRVYGSISAGDARWLTVPSTTHPGDHLSIRAIGDAVKWMDLTLTLPGRPAADHGLSPADQIWYWKETGTLLALVGGVLILLGAFERVLALPLFGGLVRTARGAVAHPDRRWWATFLLASLIPAVTYYALIGLGAAFVPSALFPQGVTNQILIWALGNALIVLALSAWMNRGRSGGEGARRRLSDFPLTLLTALLAVVVLYLAVMVSDWLFKTDLRFWVVALKPMAMHHLPIFLAYLIPFTAFFYVTQRSWLVHSSLQTGSVHQYVSTMAATVGGFCTMVILLYVWLLIDGRLPGVDPLFTIVAIQFVPILSITSIVSVFCWRRTGDALAGAVISGLFVTWYIVAGQATHV